MESRHDEQVRAYRETLLASLRGRTERRDRGRAEMFQVFVNQESVGTLDGRRADAWRLSLHRARAIHTVEVRSESGELVGGVCAQEFDRKTAKFPVGRSMLDVSVHNRPDGGTATVALETVSPVWSRIPARLAASVSRWGAGLAAMRPSLWAPVQVVMALAVVFLLVDRFTDRWEAHDATVRALSSTTRPVEMRLEASLEETKLALARQGRALEQVAQRQEDTVQTIKTQQQAVASLQRAVETVAQRQQQLSVTVKAAQPVAKSPSDHEVRAIEERLEKTLRSIESERERVFDHIFHIADAQERIARQQQKLEHDVLSLQNRELRTSLEQQAVAVAKMLSAQEASKGATVGESVAEPAGGPKQEPKAYLVTFWVSFQDGTPEESIEQFLKDIHGRKGPGNAGWYPIEINLPKPQASDELLESLKKTKIVKAITTSFNTAPNPQ